MKRKWIIGAVALTIALITVIMAQSQYYNSIYIRILLYLHPEATFTNTGSTTLTGTTTLSGTTIISGATSLTSVDTLNITGGITSGSGFWAGAPLPNSDPSTSFQYFEDFIGIPLVVTTNAFEGWKAAGDASYVIASAAGTLGGIVSVTPVTGSNNEIYFQLGELGTETFLEYTESSGKKNWLEFNFTTDDTTDSGNIFLGLAEEGSAAANFINDDGNDFADKDLVGFMIFEANPDTIEFCWQTAGGTFNRDTLAIIIDPGVFITAGINFDGDSTIAVYINGSSVLTFEQDATLFPDTEELAPIIASKNGAQDKSVSLNWIKLVSER